MSVRTDATQRTERMPRKHGADETDEQHERPNIYVGCWLAGLSGWLTVCGWTESHSTTTPISGSVVAQRRGS